MQRLWIHVMRGARRMVLVGLVTMLAAFAAAAAGEADAGSAAAVARVSVWVGRITVDYDYLLDRPGSTPATGWRLERKGRATIRAYADGTATVSIDFGETSDNRGLTCGLVEQRLITQEGRHVARVAPPSVTVDARRGTYRVGYGLPGFRTRKTTRQKYEGGPPGCEPLDTTTIDASSSRIPTIPIDGRAGSRPTTVSGTRMRERPCAAASCVERIKVTWQLSLVPAARREGERGGRGRGGLGGYGPAGGECRNLVTGTTEADRLTGTGLHDVISGLAGDDVLDGGAGHDCLYGDEGNDALTGGNGNDLLRGGQGVDTFNGGPGNDVIDAADGAAETISCGGGRDAVDADRADRLTGCELVTRR